MISIPATSLRFRLMTLVVLAMLPVLGLMFYHASLARDRKIHELQEHAERMSELAAGSVGKVIEGSRQMLLSLAFAEPVRSLNIPATNALFNELLGQSTPFVNFGLVQSDGLVIASALPLKSPVCLAYRPWFSRLQQTRGFSIGDYQIGAITGKPTLNIAFPLPNQSAEHPLAAVFGALKLDALQDCLSLHQIPPEAVLLVVDGNGTYVARNPGFDKLVGTKSHSWAALQARGGGMGGFVEATGADGIDRMYHYTPVPGSANSLFVAVGISKSVVLAESRADFLHNLLLLCVFSLTALLCASFAADRAILRHVRRLTDASHRLAEGDWSVQTEMRRGAIEFQQLGRTFDEMASALKQHQDHLENLVEARTAELMQANAEAHQGRIMLARIIDSVPQAVFWKDHNSVYLGCNKVFARRAGIDDPAEIVGKTDFELHWPKQDAAKYISDDREVMERNRPKINYFEQEQWPDGTRRWVNTTKIPLTDESCRINGVLGVFDDVTERKLAEESLMESETFLRETQEIASLGSYTLNIATGVWTSSDILQKLFGIDQSYDHSVEGWKTLIHPDDRSMMRDYFTNHVVGHKQPFDKEYRIIRHDDRAECWVHGRGKLEFDEQGNPVKMLGTIQDITAFKQAEAEQQRIIQELQNAMAHVKLLHGLLPICSGCKKIRDDQGYWSQIEAYISEHSEAQFSHGLCPDCTLKYFPEYKDDLDKLV